MASGFLSGTAWTGQVIWSQVSVGVLAVFTAGLLWRPGLRYPPRHPAPRA